jgi:hypothetical protein
LKGKLFLVDSLVNLVICDAGVKSEENSLSHKEEAELEINNLYINSKLLAFLR